MTQQVGQETAPTWWRPYHVKTRAATTGWWLNWRTVSQIMRRSVDQESRSLRSSVSIVTVSICEHIYPSPRFRSSWSLKCLEIAFKFWFQAKATVVF